MYSIMKVRFFYVAGYFDVAIREDFMGNPESQSKIE